MKYEHIAWMQEGKSDKVWGMIMLQDSGSRWDNNKYVSFWGRRGAKLQTKIVECNRYEAQKMAEKKIDKGYHEVNKNRLDEVYPEFQSDLEKTAFWAAFKV
jgi:hypothetical protein